LGAQKSPQNISGHATSTVSDLEEEIDVLLQKKLMYYCSLEKCRTKLHVAKIYKIKHLDPAMKNNKFNSPSGPEMATKMWHDTTLFR